MASKKKQVSTPHCDSFFRNYSNDARPHLRSIIVKQIIIILIRPAEQARRCVNLICLLKVTDIHGTHLSDTFSSANCRQVLNEPYWQTCQLCLKFSHCFVIYGGLQAPVTVHGIARNSPSLNFSHFTTVE